MKHFSTRTLICTLLLRITGFIWIPGTIQAAVVWSGPSMTFTKPDGADWTLAQNQDRLAVDVWITRGSTHGIYNIAQEAGYSHFSSPLGTEWAYGSAANWSSLTFTNWETWASSPPTTVGKPAVLHLLTDDIYLDIKFLSWSSMTGGGFSYTRSTPAMPPSEWKGGSVSNSTDWSNADNWNPNGAYPDGPGASAIFGNEATFASIVDMISAGRTLGNMTFNAASSTTIQSSGGFALTWDNGGNGAVIEVTGSHTIRAPVLLNDNATISGLGTLNFSGGISGNHALTVLGSLTAASIDVNSLFIGSAIASQAVPEPRFLSMLLPLAACGFAGWRRFFAGNNIFIWKNQAWSQYLSNIYSARIGTHRVRRKL